MNNALRKSNEIEVSRLTVDEAIERVHRGEPITFVDSRSTSAWSKADQQIAGSVRVPPDEAEQFVSRVPKDRAVITYCT